MHVFVFVLCLGKWYARKDIKNETKQETQDPARAKPLPVALISFSLHKLFVPLHVKKRGVISRDLGHSTQKKKADFASAGPADIEYQNSHCVLWPRSRDTKSTGKPASSNFCTDFWKWQDGNSLDDKIDDEIWTILGEYICHYDKEFANIFTEGYLLL